MKGQTLHDWCIANNRLDLLSEWDQEKNGELTPKSISRGNARKVWWKCSRFNHEWQASVGSRTGMGSGCPICMSTYRVSINEKAIAYYLSKVTEIIPSYRPAILCGKEIDIYVPELKLGIEYDGVYGHKIARDRELKDRKKTDLCKEHGITLIRVREEGLPVLEDCICFSTSPKPNLAGPSIEKVIKYVCASLNCFPPDVNIDRDYTEILREKEIAIRSNSLGELYPELIPEWNEVRNAPMSPFTVRANTNHKVWWKCEKGHEWQAAISSRVRGHGCPYCSGARTLKGKTDLATQYPELAKEWDQDKNGNLTPHDVTPGTDRKVWWIGPCGHSWDARVTNRTHRGSGCPYCSTPPTRILVGFNDLATVNPQLAKEWDYEKNDNLSPQDVMAGSTKKVWWKCEKGHEWQATVNSRNHSKTGCPKCACSSKRFADSILITHPQIASEWDYEKNDGITPSEVKAGSDKQIWWVCSSGHSWSASPYYRCRTNSTCPYCSGKKVLEGYNDLNTTHPELVLEWDYCKNTDISPSEVTVKMDRYVWWKCEKGHEWKAMIRNRLSSGCPFCGGAKVIPGKTDLETNYPDLSKEWDVVKNNGILPNQVACVTAKKYWWRCEHNHSWRASVSNRTKGKTGCPYCSGRDSK